MIEWPAGADLPQHPRSRRMGKPSMNANLAHRKVTDSDCFARLATLFSQRLLKL